MKEVRERMLSEVKRWASLCCKSQCKLAFTDIAYRSSFYKLSFRRVEFTEGRNQRTGRYLGNLKAKSSQSWLSGNCCVRTERLWMAGLITRVVIFEGESDESKSWIGCCS